MISWVILASGPEWPWVGARWATTGCEVSQEFAGSVMSVTKSIANRVAFHRDFSTGWEPALLAIFCLFLEIRVRGGIALGARCHQRFTVDDEPDVLGDVGRVVADALDVLRHEQKMRARRDIARVFHHVRQQRAED